jgi:hypothetical protein
MQILWGLWWRLSTWIHLDSVFEPDYMLILPLIIALPFLFYARSDFIGKSDRLIQLHQQSIPVIHVKLPPTAYLLRPPLSALG